MVADLEGSFVSDLGCSEPDARVLRDRVLAMQTIVGTAEDSEEDLILRLREPDRFGEFALRIIHDSEVGVRLRRQIAEHAFDLLPLPQHETDVIVVTSRAPRGLLGLAAFLQSEDCFTVLHAMHLVYAVFLDRPLIHGVQRVTRSSVLDRLLRDDEIPESIRILYAALHLSAVREVEAHGALKRLLRATPHPNDVIASFARLAAADDGGRRSLIEIARAEGLIPTVLGVNDEATILASVPRLPPRLAALARRWLDHRQAR